MRPLKPKWLTPGQYAFAVPGGGVGVVEISAEPIAESSDVLLKARAWRADKAGTRSVTNRGTAIILPERFREVTNGGTDKDKLVNEITDVVRLTFNELVAHIEAVESIPVSVDNLAGKQRI